MAIIIEAYEQEHYAIKMGKGIDALKFLRIEHNLSQKDLPEIGSQGVVSEVLSGKKKLNLYQIKRLSKKFNVTIETFLYK